MTEQEKIKALVAVLRDIQKLEEHDSIGHDLLFDVDQVLDKVEG